jgi:hypothetical protein
VTTVGVKYGKDRTGRAKVDAMVAQKKPPGGTNSWWRLYCAARAQRRRFNLAFCDALPFQRVWSDTQGRRYYWRPDERPLFGWACLKDLYGPCPSLPQCPAVAVVEVNGVPLPMSEKVNDYLRAFPVGRGRRAVRVPGGLTTDGLPKGPSFALTCLYEELEGWATELAAIVARGGTGRHLTPAADRAIEEWINVASELTPEETLWRGGRLVGTVQDAIERGRRLDREAKRRRRAAQREPECAPLRERLFAYVGVLLDEADAADQREGRSGGD